MEQVEKQNVTEEQESKAETTEAPVKAGLSDGVTLEKKVDLLHDMLYKNMQQQKNSARLRTIFMGVAAAAMVGIFIVVAVAMGSLLPQINGAINEVLAMLENVQMDQVASIINDAQVAIHNAVTTVEKVNAVLDHIVPLVDNLNDVDVASLNAAIQSLKATVEPLAEFVARVESIMG